MVGGLRSDTETTTYKLAYSWKPVAGKRTEQPWRAEVAARIERMLAERRVRANDNKLPVDVVLAPLAEVRLSTYGRDFTERTERRIAEVEAADTTVTERIAADTGTKRPTVVRPTRITYVKITGPMLPEPYVVPKSEYQSTHGRLGGRIVTERILRRPRSKRRLNKVNL